MAGTTLNWKDDSERNHEIVYRFEKAFAEGKNPQVKDYLEGEGASRWKLLLELLHSDLELRIRAGQSLRVQEYLKEHAELAQHPDDLASLIKTEIRCLRQMGIQPMLQKYQAEYGSILGKRIEELFAQESRGTREAKIGSIIAGKYKLLAELGEGGMGSVYAAEQTQPVRRVVAIKLIKPGMDSSGVLARFEAERQALAMMDHPNIARMLDGGITEDGQPYFVMEQVKGLPITRFCDQERLSLDDRIELFMAVCQGVQHAHQKGIIHRDLKPSNILVTLIDGKPVPKVIDFGVAKALHQKLTDKTMYTEAGRMVGTLEYMAPEQADLNNLDVDTRADVYALGVVLYELLTGQVPFTSKELRSAAYDEMLRIIREMEPPRPSTKLSSSVDLSKVAAMRQVAPKQLTSVVAGELDWIVMKCLEKERGRRYETPEALGAELNRFLKDEPVQASPPSSVYRFRKFYVRNRAIILTTAATFIVLLGGVAGTSLGWLEATTQERRASRERDEKEMAWAAEAAAGAQLRLRLAQIEKAVGLFRSIFSDLDPDKEKKQGRELRTILAEKLKDVAKQLTGETIADQKEVARLQVILGTCLTGMGEYDAALDILHQAIETFSTTQNESKIDALRAKSALGLAYQAAGRVERAVPFLEEVYRSQEDLLGANSLETIETCSRLALAYQAAGHATLALPLFEKVHRSQEAMLGPNASETLDTRGRLVLAYHAAGRMDRVIRPFEDLLDRFDKDIRKDIRIPNAGMFFCLDHEKVKEAVPPLERNLHVLEAKLGVDHPRTLVTSLLLADLYRRSRFDDKARLLFQRSLSSFAKILGERNTEIPIVRAMLELENKDTQKLKEVVLPVENSLAVLKTRLGESHPRIFTTSLVLAEIYEKLNLKTKAIQLYEIILQDILNWERKYLGLTSTPSAEKFYFPTDTWNTITRKLRICRLC